MLLAHSRIAVAAARVRIAAHCGAASSQAAGASLWQRRALSAAVSPAGAASGSHGGTPVAGRQHLPTDLSRDLQSGVDHAQATPAFLPDALSAEESAQLVVPVRVDRPGENLEAKRSRLLYQSRKRGILEMDLLLSTFTIKHLPGMDAVELDALDRLMDENDWDVYYWITGEKPIPEDMLTNPIIPQLIKHMNNEAKVVRRMPDL